ncbi:hypothetical protein AVEN_56663-1 [Araneus ventricosus]|uniref:Uncharacterized protein n=1 Tax=Araneus ventricosus TaxID=182803 RepID=A0A4Y2HZN7_ARAVE|nr:hypothetical protein AVEN_56663-1 [Araneus ventricosus]
MTLRTEIRDIVRFPRQRKSVRKNMKPLTFFIFFCGTIGTISMLPQGAPNDDAVLLPSPSADRPHHVQRRVIEEEDDPFFGDPAIRFFLRMLMSPFSIFSPERKARPHASKLSAGRNSTDQKMAKSENMEKMNETEKSDAIFGKIESKPKRSDEFGVAHRKHFRFDSFPFVFHRPAAERSGPVDPEMTETADDISTGKHFGKLGTLKTAVKSKNDDKLCCIRYYNDVCNDLISVDLSSHRPINNAASLTMKVKILIPVEE